MHWMRNLNVFFALIEIGKSQVKEINTPLNW
jgi:hypothetical protein